MQSYAFRGLMKTIASLVPDVEVQDKIFLQLEEYKKSTGDFGLPIAVRQRQKLNPGKKYFYAMGLWLNVAVSEVLNFAMRKNSSVFCIMMFVFLFTITL
jgi:hypothetical protein